MKNPPSIPASLARIAPLKRWSSGSAAVGSISLVMICVIATWSLWQIDKTDYWVEHTYGVISASQQLLFDLKDAEAAGRAFRLQPDSQLETDIQSAGPRLHEDLSKLGALTTDNPEQQERLGRLEPLVDRTIDRLRGSLAALSGVGLSEAQRARDEQQIRQDEDKTWVVSMDVQNAEYVLLAERQRLRKLRLMEGFVLTLGSSSLALIALLASSLQVRRAVVSLIESGRKRHEDESMITSLFEAGPEAIVIIDSDGKIMQANLESARLFGYEPGEINGQPFKALIPDSCHKQYEAFLQAYFESASPSAESKRLELPLRRKEGDFFASVSFGHIASSGGHLRIAFVSDITQRRAYEQALRAQAEQLRLVTGKLLTAQEDERRRIARNLHDDLNQSLAYLAIGLGNLAGQVADEEASLALRSLQAKARESAELVRNISHQLHPAVLDDLGLEEAVRDLGDEFHDRTDFAVSIECGEIPRSASPDAIACLYYVASECLRNVAKHAHASSVNIEISVRDGSMWLSVADDGQGMPDGPGRIYSGIGITTMRERVYLLGGTLSINRRSPHGTMVEAALPI